MARYTGPKCKLSRREGTDLFLKSARRSLDDASANWPQRRASTAPSQVNACRTTACNCAKSRSCVVSMASSNVPVPSARCQTAARRKGFDG